MQKRIQFFVLSLLMFSFANAQTNLDKCFEKEALPYMSSACEQVLKSIKTEQTYNCKSVVDVRSLVLLGEALDVAGNLKSPAPPQALTSYTAYYKDKVEPYYKSKCFTQAQSSAGVGTTAAVAIQQSGRAGTTGVAATAQGAIHQAANNLQAAEKLEKDLAGLDAQPKRAAVAQTSAASASPPPAAQVQVSENSTALATGVQITQEEIDFVQSSTRSKAAVTSVSSTQDANGNIISRTYSQDGKTFAISAAGGSTQVQVSAPNSGSAVIKSGNATESDRIVVDLSKVAGGKVIDQAQAAIRVDAQGRYLMTADICTQGTPADCQERSRQTVDVTDEMKKATAAVVAALGAKSVCPSGKCEFTPFDADPIDSQRSIVGDVANTKKISTPVPLSFTEDVIHVCASNPAASGCAGETFITKDGLVVGFSQDGKTLLSGTAEQLASADATNFAKKNAVVVEKADDGSTSTRNFDANGEQTSHIGWISFDLSLPPTFVSAAKLPRNVTPAAGDTAGGSAIANQGHRLPETIDTAHDEAVSRGFGGSTQPSTASDGRIGSHVATEMPTVSNASARTVVNGRLHCADDMDDECQQLSTTEAYSGATTGARATSSAGGGGELTSSLASSSGAETTTATVFYDGTTGDSSGFDGSGGGVGLAELASKALSPSQAAAQLDQEKIQLANFAASNNGITESDMSFFENIKGQSNDSAITNLKAAATALVQLGKRVNPTVDIETPALQAVEKYTSESKSCADYVAMARTACIEENSPTIKKTIEASKILLPVIQTVVGMNDACSKISKAIGTVNKGLLVASVVCGGFQTMCSIGCGSTVATFESITTTLINSGGQIMQSAANEVKDCYVKAQQQAQQNNIPDTSKVQCQQFVTKYEDIVAKVKEAQTKIKASIASESNAKDPKSVVGKVVQCGSFTETLKQTAAGLLSLAQSNMQAKDCAAKTASSTDANKCQNPNYEGSMECLCQRAEFKNTASCRTYATGCAVAGQMKNSAGLCVAQAEACLDPVNANKSECITVVANNCSKPENAGKQECICLVTPGAAGCGGTSTTQTAGVTGGATGASTLVPQTPPSNTTNNGGGLVDGSGLQKMSGDRTTPVANLNGSGSGTGRLGFGSDGVGLADSAAGSTGSGAALAAPGSVGGTGGGAANGGLGGLGGRDPASEANGKGKNTGGYKGASADTVGGGGFGGGAAMAGLDWGREKNKQEALKKLNDKQERNKMAGATILKDNGVTGPTGKTLWEKVSTRYRETKSSLMADQ